MSTYSTRQVLMMACLASFGIGLVLSRVSPVPLFAQVVADPKPQVPEQICGPCIIYGVPVPGQAGVPDGIYQINTCTGAVTFVQDLPGAFNLAVHDSGRLFVADALNLFDDTISTLATPPNVGTASAGALGMGEGGRGSLFDVDAFGQLHSLIPQPPTLVGTGTIAGFPVQYPGDIVLSPHSCHLLSSVSYAATTAWVRVNRSDGSVAVLNTGVATRVGYGYNGSGQLWADAGHGIQRIDEATGLSASGVLVTTFGATPNVMWVDLASNPCNTCGPEIVSDLGDAPDSTNHFAVSL